MGFVKLAWKPIDCKNQLRISKKKKVLIAFLSCFWLLSDLNLMFRLLSGCGAWAPECMGSVACSIGA